MNFHTNMLLRRGYCSFRQNYRTTPTAMYRAPLMHIRMQQIRSLRTNTNPLQSTRLGSLQPTSFEPFACGGGAIPPMNVLKACIFTGAFTVGCFMGATILEYENTRSMMLDKARRSKLLWGARQQVLNSKNYLENLKNEIKHFWEHLNAGEKVFVPLCALNVIVFGLWRVPAMRKTMMTYFCSNPAAQAICWPMFLSTFSHYSAFHLFTNMYVLHSFANAAVASMGKEQFLAVYLSAGVFASLASIVYKAVTAQAGMSIGASGAIMAVLAYVCAKYPDTQLSILFIPAYTFTAGAAIKVIMGVDLAGCIMGWKFFDHAAHLGGALFGLFWVYCGSEVWQKRLPFLTMYHDLRKQK